MNPGASYAHARNYLQRSKPKLLRTFDDLYVLLGATPETPASPALHLTLASEFVLISPPVVRTAVSRGELDIFAGLTYTFSQVSPVATGTFVDVYPVLPYPLSEIAHELSRFASPELRVASNPGKLLHLCIGQSPERTRSYLSLFAEMVVHSPGAISDFLSSFDELTKAHSADFLHGWLRRGADLISSGRTEEGVRFLLAQSRESRHDLGITSAFLEDIKKVLQIYGTSIANSPISVTSNRVSTFGIDEPYTDGKSVFLPNELGYFNSIEENEGAFSALAAIQAAQVDLGTFGLTSSELSFQADLQTRYGLVLPDVMEHVSKQYASKSKAIRERASGETEVVFTGDRVIEVLSTPHEELFYRFPTPDLARELFCLLEGYRIESNLSARYAGLEADFALLNQALARLLPVQTSGGFVGAVHRLITLTLEGKPALVNSGTPGRQADVELTAEFQENLALLSNPGVTVHDTALATFRIYNAFYDRYQIIPWCRRNDVRDLFSPTAKTSLNPEIVYDITPTLFRGMAPKPVYEDLEEQAIQDVDLTGFTQTEKRAFELKEAILNGEVTIYRYPEFDANRGENLAKHCTLYESILDSGEPVFYRKTLKEHHLTFKRLRKRFLMMQPEELELSRRWLVGDEIHIGDAFDFATDLMRGSAPDGKIYQRSNRNRRDIAAAILLDASSSTEELVEGESILDVEKKALCLLAGVLDPIGDTFGIFSYFSMGRHNNFYMVAKDFHEKWTPRTQGRIDAVTANAANRDGCAIRHTALRLLERPEKTKLLLLLSDGIPADAGYGSQDGAKTTEYGIEDTRRAILDAKIAGIVPYCITIDKSAKSYIPRLYGDFHYTVIRSVSELPEKLSKLYLRLTR